jgi:hypothetical protein
VTDFDVAIGGTLRARFVTNVNMLLRELDTLADVAVTHFVFSKGIWSMLNYGQHPEDMRVQLQLFLVEVRRRFPAARVTVVPTHRVRPVLATHRRCSSIAREAHYRDAVLAAVANVNAVLSDAVVGPTVVNGTARLIDVLDMYDLTSTPEARIMSDIGDHGHHYSPQVNLNILIIWLRAPQVVPNGNDLPASPRTNGTDGMGLMFHGEPSWVPMRHAYLTKLLQLQLFHRMVTPAPTADIMPCDVCNLLAYHAGTMLRAVHPACEQRWQQIYHSCFHPLGMVATPARQVPNTRDTATLRCVKRAMERRGFSFSAPLEE